MRSQASRRQVTKTVQNDPDQLAAFEKFWAAKHATDSYYSTQPRDRAVAIDAWNAALAQASRTELTLRDRMAIEVLPAIYEAHSMLTDRAAELAYEQADEMMK